MSSNKRFYDIKVNVGNETRDTSSSFASIIGVYANNRYRDIISRLITADLFESYRTTTVTTTSGTRSYVMPYDYSGQVIYAHDSTNDRTLDVITEQELYNRYGSDIDESSTPIALILMADSNVRVQPSSSSAIKAISSSGSDNTQSVFIRGISGSAEYYETIALSGTASASSVNSYDYVLTCVKDAVTTGTITLSYVTGSDTASTIAPESLEQKYQRVGFHYVPNGTYSINIRYKRDVKPMVSANDSPLIDIADGIEIGAIADSWRYKRQFANAQEFEQKYELWLDRYINQRLMGQVQQFDITPYNRNETY